MDGKQKFPKVYWYNETRVQTTSDLWSWLLDQEIAASKNGAAAELVRLAVERIWSTGPDGTDEWVVGYDANVNYDVKAREEPF